MTKQYTREFKVEAVRLAETSDQIFEEVAEGLGISKNAHCFMVIFYTSVH